MFYPFFEEFYVNELQKIKDIFLKYINLPYTYNYFSNGQKIEKIHRRLYHSSILQKIQIGNPFDSENPNFYKKINKIKMYSLRNADDFSNVMGSSGTVKKLKIVNKLMRLLYKRIGYERYLTVLKLFQAYNWYENQYHLIDNDKNILFFRKRII